MELFFHIILTSIVPILLLTLMGVLLDRWFHLDLRTLSKLNFYLFLPAYILKSFYVTDLNSESFEIFACALIILFANSLLAGIVAKWQGYGMGKTEIVRNATMFSNIGNLGVALGTFVFANDPYIIDGATPYLHDGVIAIIATFIIQTIFCNSLGFYQAGKGKLTTRDSIRTILHIPIIYCVPLSILAHYYSPIALTQTKERCAHHICVTIDCRPYRSSRCRIAHYYVLHATASNCSTEYYHCLRRTISGQYSSHGSRNE